MELFISYCVLFVINSIVLYGANAVFPTHIVLGTGTITKAWAIIHSMGILALINTFAIPFIREFENKMSKTFSDIEWIIVYFFINFAGVWTVTRFADELGFGISSFLVAAGLAIVLDVVQGFAMTQLEKVK